MTSSAVLQANWSVDNLPSVGEQVYDEEHGGDTITRRA